MFQHLSLAMLVAHYAFKSPVMRDSWVMSADARQRTYVPGNDPWRIGRIGDEVLREYEAGGDGRRGDRPPSRSSADRDVLARRHECRAWIDDNPFV